MKRIKITALILCVVMSLAVLTSCAKPVTAMEYEGKEVTVNHYSYWLSLIKSKYVSSANDTAEYWATKYSNGETYEEKMREIVDYNVKINLVCLKLFEDMGLTVTAAEEKEIQTALDDLMKPYGSKSKLNAVLANYNMNYDMLKEVYTIELKVSKVFDALYAEGGQRRIDDETLDAYYRENYSRLEMIILYDEVAYEKDENGKPVFDDSTNSYKTVELTDEEKAAKKALADDIMKKLEAGEDFDKLKAEYNEFFDSEKYEYGFFISSNDVSAYSSEMVIAARQMKIGEVRRLEEEGAIYIVKRLELTDKPYSNENYLEMFEYILDYCQQADFNQYMDGLIKGVTVNDEELGKISVVDAPLLSY